MGRHYQQKYLNKSINEYIKLLNKRMIYIIYISFYYIFYDYYYIISKDKETRTPND